MYYVGTWWWSHTRRGIKYRSIDVDCGATTCRNRDWNVCFMSLLAEGQVTTSWWGLVGWRALTRYWEWIRERWSRTGSISVSWGHLNTAGGYAQGRVLDSLNFLNQEWWGVRESNGSCIHTNWLQLVPVGALRMLIRGKARVTCLTCALCKDLTCAVHWIWSEDRRSLPVYRGSSPGAVRSRSEWLMDGY